MTFYDFLDARSFSNVWYWIMLSVSWSLACHWTVGVPFDAVIRAQRDPERFQDDLEQLVAANARRIASFDERGAGVVFVAITSFVFSSLFVLGFLYDQEFLQAIFLLGGPIIFVFVLSARSGRRMMARELRGEALRLAIARRRFWNQVIGLMAVLVAVTWGMVKVQSLAI